MAGMYWIVSLVTALSFIAFDVVPALAQTKITVGQAGENGFIEKVATGYGLR